MECCTYTVPEAYDVINFLDLVSKSLQLRKYIKKRLEKNDVKITAKLRRPDILPALYTNSLKYQPISASVKQLFPF